MSLRYSNIEEETSEIARLPIHLSIIEVVTTRFTYYLSRSVNPTILKYNYIIITFTPILTSLYG